MRRHLQRELMKPEGVFRSWQENFILSYSGKSIEYANVYVFVLMVEPCNISKPYLIQVPVLWQHVMMKSNYFTST